ncbi:MAG TPA: hypothetical protein VGO61_02825 [Steroidobacteraceae bacterium]|jgi:hypothetical protein|nr:hypothetical protein [Steroidobacteraceae bacterium]
MKISRFLAVAGLVAAGTAVAGGGGNSSVLFKFDGGLGNQVFRSGAGGVPALNTVAGVNPAGAPWGITGLDVTIKTNGDIRGTGEGVLLYGADGLGSRAGPRQLILSLFCRVAPVAPAITGALNPIPFNSEPVDLDEDGDFVLHGKLTGEGGATPPLNCGDTVDNRPILLIRSVTPANSTTGTLATPAAWFAAGLLAGKHHNGHGGKGDDCN